jgi:hypothetical protein
LSGSVYIPKRLSDSLAADGNALTVTGQSPYPANVEVPCITGNGTNVYAATGVVLGDTGSVSCLYSPSDDDLLNNRYILAAVDSGSSVVLLQITASAGLAIGVGSTILTVSGFSFSAGSWYSIALSWTPTTYAISVNGAVIGSGSRAGVMPVRSLFVLAGNFGSPAGPVSGKVSDLRITTGGVTTHFPLQDGPGSSNTNRDLSYIKSDGTYGVVSGAIVNGTVSTIWANRCPYAEDWCVNYGGDIAANGAFLPGQISGSLAADGTAKTLEAGKFGNPYSRANFNPFTAAELNGLGTETAYAKGTARQSVSPTDTKFRRTATAGDDRFITTSTALTGTDKTNTEGYVA